LCTRARNAVHDSCYHVNMLCKWQRWEPWSEERFFSLHNTSAHASHETSALTPKEQEERVSVSCSAAWVYKWK